MLAAAVEWASLHEPIDEADTAAWWMRGEPVALAGEGTPLVSEYAVAELAAAVGLTTDAGRALIGQALELAWRLPRLWRLVCEGEVPSWRARRVADQTMGLTPAAAAYVDAHVAAVAGKVGTAQLDRLVLEARRRFMTDPVPVDEYSCPEARHVTVHDGQVSFDGTVHLTADVDLADALDLERAVSVTADQLRLGGSAETLDARRALALGEIARQQLSLTFSGGDGSPETDGGRPAVAATRAQRPVVLYVHLADEALAGASGVGRCENTRTPLSMEAIRAWCGNPDARVTVTPVIDLREHVRVDAYEVPDRLKRRIGLRDLGCVFPWCTRPARACDHDHVIPHDQGGSTCSCNLAPLCRHHHRLKTHAPWRYVMPEPGVYIWTSPHGYVFARDHSGTTDVTTPGAGLAAGCPPDE